MAHPVLDGLFRRLLTTCKVSQFVSSCGSTVFKQVCLQLLVDFFATRNQDASVSTRVLSA